MTGAALVLLATSAAPARAEIITLSAVLTGSQEIPPTGSAAFGTARFVLNAEHTALSFTATIFGLDVTGNQTPGTTADNLLNAHIHAGTAPFGTNQPVVWGFFGTPFNDNNPNDSVVTPFATGVVGTFSGKWDLLEGNNTTLAAQLPNILAGRAYINFHTTQFPGGEIRGNIVADPVPEPATLAVFGAVAGAAGLATRRRRRSVG